MLPLHDAVPFIFVGRLPNSGRLFDHEKLKLQTSSAYVIKKSCVYRQATDGYPSENLISQLNKSTRLITFEMHRLASIHAHITRLVVTRPRHSMNRPVATFVVCLLVLTNVAICSCASLSALTQTPYRIAGFPGEWSPKHSHAQRLAPEGQKPFCDGFAVLYISMLIGPEAIETALEQLGASCINSLNNQGQSLLHIAASENNVKVIDALLTHGASVDVKNADGDTPMQISFNAGHCEAVALFLTHQADINVKDLNQNTLLHLAVQRCQHRMVLVLLNHGADALARNSMGQLPLHIAARHGFLEITSLLLENISSICKRYASDPPLAIDFRSAAQRGFSEIISLILGNAFSVGKHGTSNPPLAINFRDKYGRTPLFLAAKHDHIDTVKALARIKNLVDVGNRVRWTPLHIAAFSGNTAMVQLLLEIGAKSTVRSEFGRTALHCTAFSGSVDAAKALLVNNPALVNEMDVRGWTPLHAAACYGKLAMVNLLLCSGGNINAKTKKGSTPLHFAVRRMFDDTSKVPLQFSAKKHANVSNNYTKGHLAIIKVLLNHGADDCARNAAGFTPLHHAVFENDIVVVKQLLACMRKSSINEKSTDGRTPFRIAVDENHTDMINLFSKHKGIVVY